MNTGKFICNHLKSIRKNIAKENGIAFNSEPCHHQGPCRGTCPYCEKELQDLEEALAHRIRLGQLVTVAGIGVTLAGCQGTETAPAATMPTSSNITEEQSRALDDSVKENSCITPGINEDNNEMDIFPGEYEEVVYVEELQPNKQQKTIVDNRAHTATSQANIERIEHEMPVIDNDETMLRRTPLLQESYAVRRGEDGSVVVQTGVIRRRRHIPLLIPKTPFEQYQEKQERDPMPTITMEEEHTNPFD